MEPRRGNVTCAACETIPCVNNYLIFGAYDDLESTAQITRIALTQVFPITTPLTIQLYFIINLVCYCPSKIIIIVLIIIDSE